MKRKTTVLSKFFFKQPRFTKDSLYEVDLVEAQTDYRDPIIVGFFILQWARLRMLELYYNFFQKYSNQIKFEDLEIDTESLDLAPAENNTPD